MDTKYTIIRTTELKGSTFRTHVLDFQSFSIAEYDFEAVFKSSLGHIVLRKKLVKTGNMVHLDLIDLQDKTGRFSAEVWMSNSSVRDLAVLFEILITASNTGIHDDTTHNVVVTFEELNIPVSVTQSNVSINLNYDSLTEEQKAELRFDYSDFTPEQIAAFKAPAIEAADLANTAATNANTAATNANNKADLANSAATSANSSAIQATNAANLANEKAILANDAATNANNKATLAQTSADNATIATTNAITATSEANTATTNANNAATNADAKALLAETAAANANTAATNATAKIAETETARQNAITATTDANTAATNANNAANTANTSAANADAKALLAEEAATKANTAAANANAIVMNSIYGVRIDNAVSNPILTRLGSPILHQTLPIQSLMRRCLLKADGTVNYYLDANDSTLKENGTAAVLDGTDGDVMVEIPKHYRRVDIITSTITEVWISQTNLPGFEEIPLMYISAYQATVDRTVPATLKLASVVNTTANFRGGNNNAAWDLESRTLLGRPVTSISRTNARTYARNKGAAGKNGAGWNQLTYNAYKALFWLYFVEYANKNSQATFNSALDANGFRQGGLGAGVTDLNWTKWNTFNSYYPFVPMGFTNSLGNKTGVVAFTMPTEYDSVPFTTYVPSYRGVENPFGHIYQWVDGINVKAQAADAGGRTVYFATDNPSLFQDSNYNGFREVGDSPRANGYIKSLILGQFADFLPKENTGAGSTTYWTDNYYHSAPSTGEVLRGLFVGGNADRGSVAGLAFSNTEIAPSITNSGIGLRLVFHP